MNPVVTFIVPCYRYGRYLGGAIDSLLAQTLRELEVIVVDDASPDETGEVLARYEGNPRLRAVRHAQNQGHIRSYNDGIALARGKYLAILSADDYIMRDDAVERQVALFEQHPRVGLVYTAHALVEDGRVTGTVIPTPRDYVRPGVDEFRALMWGNYMLHSGTMLRRDVQMELGPYDARLKHTGDWDMWLRASISHDVGYVAEPLYGYRLHGTNMFHNALPPQVETDQVIATIERAFAALPADCPPDIRNARPAVLAHGLLQTSWWDLFHGRRRRTWQGVVYALRRRPGLITSGEFWRFLPRVVLMTGAGRDRYRRVIEKVGALRQTSARRGRETRQTSYRR